MKTRCTNPKNQDWEYYGGRGIIFDPSWKEFKNFYTDMGDAPNNLTLDRSDCNGLYCKANCRWATHHEQRMNQRRMLG